MRKTVTEAFGLSDGQDRILAKKCMEIQEYMMHLKDYEENDMIDDILATKLDDISDEMMARVRLHMANHVGREATISLALQRAGAEKIGDYLH
jgi:hypothetical protein